MSDSFFKETNKTEIDLNYKYGKLYAINLIIDKEEKDLYGLKSIESNDTSFKISIEAKELELEKSKDERDRIFKEISILNKEIK